MSEYGFKECGPGKGGAPVSIVRRVSGLRFTTWGSPPIQAA
jgi:hypothetical protein